MINTFPFNSIKPSGSSSYSRMFIWYIEVREWLSNLPGLAAQERKEVKGIVISCWNFFLWREVGVVFVSPGFLVDEIVL